MRRIHRIERSVDLLRPEVFARRRPAYLCWTCQHQVTSFSATARATEKKLSASEKFRRKIWGTDSPPGLEDPYGGKGVFAQARKPTQKIVKEEEEDLQEVEEIAEEEPQGLYSASTDDNYEPASSWDDLEEIGDENEDDIWGGEHGYRGGFPPPRLMTDPHEISATLHRALVEVYACKQAGKEVSDLWEVEPGEDLTQSIRISPADNGAALRFSAEVSKEELIRSLTGVTDEVTERVEPNESEEDMVADRSDIDPLSLHDDTIVQTMKSEAPTESEEIIAAEKAEEGPLDEMFSMTYEDLVRTWSSSQWQEISIADPEIKFAVMKRMLQLSGIRFPDAAIKRANTVRAFQGHIIKPPKAKKLIETLAQKEDLLNLPNVSVFAKRVTPIDKEKAVGRWKIIEQELVKQGLPVTGHD